MSGIFAQTFNSNLARRYLTPLGPNEQNLMPIVVATGHALDDPELATMGQGLRRPGDNPRFGGFAMQPRGWRRGDRRMRRNDYTKWRMDQNSDIDDESFMKLTGGVSWSAWIEAAKKIKGPIRELLNKTGSMGEFAKSLIPVVYKAARPHLEDMARRGVKAVGKHVAPQIDTMVERAAGPNFYSTIRDNFGINAQKFFDETVVPYAEKQIKARGDTFGQNLERSYGKARTMPSMPSMSSRTSMLPTGGPLPLPEQSSDMPPRQTYRGFGRKKRGGFFFPAATGALVGYHLGKRRRGKGLYQSGRGLRRSGGFFGKIGRWWKRKATPWLNKAAKVVKREAPNFWKGFSTGINRFSNRLTSLPVVKAVPGMKELGMVGSLFPKYDEANQLIDRIPGMKGYGKRKKKGGKCKKGAGYGFQHWKKRPMVGGRRGRGKKYSSYDMMKMAAPRIPKVRFRTQ